MVQAGPLNHLDHLFERHGVATVN